MRYEYKEKANAYGNEYIYDELKNVDPLSAERIHVNDTNRVIRALEVYYETGKPMSQCYKDFRKPRDEFDIVMIGLRMDREKLYERINKRIDIMMEQGLIDEVKSLLDRGYSENLTSMQAIGYKEVISYLKDNCSLDETVEILKRQSRRYAKRQLTWFRKEKRVNWIDVDEFDTIDDIKKAALDIINRESNFN